MFVSREKVEELCESLFVVLAVQETAVPPVHQDVSDLLHPLVLTELHRGVVSVRVRGGLDDHQHDSLILQVCKYNSMKNQPGGFKTGIIRHYSESCRGPS